MRNYSISLVTPPGVEPVTLAEACVQCHAEQGVEDEWFGDAIAAARVAVENYVGRSLITQSWALTFDWIPAMPLYLPRGPVQALTSATMYDVDDVATVVPLSSFFLDLYSEPARLSLKYNAEWPTINPRYLNAVQIQYTAGYGATAAAVPKNVTRAMLLYIAYMYENRSGEVTDIPRAVFDVLRPVRVPQ